MFSVKGDDNFAIGASLEFYIWAKTGAKGKMVIDFAVDGKYDFAVVADEGLGSGVDTDDRQPFVAEDCLFANVAPRPVGSAMPDTFRECD